MTEEKIDKTEEQENDFDILVLLRQVWAGRRLIILFAVVAACLGFVVAKMIPNEYTASTTMVAQTSEDKVQTSGLSSLAALAGVSTGGGSGEIGPNMYPMILKSSPFLLGLMQEKIDFQKEGGSYTLYEYFTEIKKPSTLSKLSRYTIGLPGVIIAWFKSEDSVGEIGASNTSEDSELLQFTAKEQMVMGAINQLVNLSVNSQEGYVSLSAVMEDPVAVAQLTELCKNRLQEEVIARRTEAIQEELKFIQELYEEKKAEVDHKQQKLARFLDKNKNVISAQVRVQEEQLMSECTVSFEVFTSVAMQLENTKLKVKKETPIFTVIEPVSVPLYPSGPKRAVLIAIWLFVGVFLGVGVVLLRYYVPIWKEQFLKTEG